jgi:hypothetical protein
MCPSAIPSPEERNRLLSCLRRITPGPAANATSSAVLDDVVRAYGGIDVDAICRLVTDYARTRASELLGLLARQQNDWRRPRVLSDPALLCILERLEHDRYALRRSWVPAHDPADLRRIGDLWGIRVGV